MVTSKGKPLDLFLVGEPVLGNKYVPLIARMLYHLPATWKCCKVMLDNLLTFARLMAGGEDLELTPMQLEYLWIKKLLRSLGHMRSFGNIDHPGILSIFVELCKKYGFSVLPYKWGFDQPNEAMVGQGGCNTLCP